MLQLSEEPMLRLGELETLDGPCRFCRRDKGTETVETGQLEWLGYKGRGQGDMEM